MSRTTDESGTGPGGESSRSLSKPRRLLSVLTLLLLAGAVVAAPATGVVPADGVQEAPDAGSGGIQVGGDSASGQVGSSVDQSDDDIRSIEYGQTVSGEIDTDDPRSEAYRGYHEPITFQGSAGDAVTVQLFGGRLGDDFGGPGVDADPYLILVGPDGEVLARNDDGDFGLNAEVRGVVLPSDGEYTIVATSFDPEQTFGYTLALRNDTTRAVDLRSIDRNSTASGAIDKTDPRSPDRNGFYEPVTFNGSAGEAVEITMGSQVGDSYLQLLGPDGTLLAENDDAEGLNASIETTLPANGTYTIVATSFGPGDTFPYELSLSVGGQAEGGIDLREIRPGQTRQGEIDEGDPQARFLRGYFEPVTFAGSAGQSVTIDMASDAGDTYLILYGPDGNIVAQNDDADGSNARIQTTLQTDGEYTIVATSFDPEATFEYELSLSTGTGGGDGADLRNISYGETRAGELDDGDPSSDSYRGFYEPVTFAGEAGDSVVVDMTAEEDSYLILVAPNGTILAENDDFDGIDARIETTLPADGEYTIVATSFDPGAAFPYELSLRRGGTIE